MAHLFKGYVKSEGKKPLQLIKNAEYLSEPPENHDYLGVLREEYIQLDFDDENTSNKVLEIVQKLKLKCDVLKTGDGIHLYFLTDERVTRTEVGVFNAIGLKCDIGLGHKSRVVPLRITKELERKRVVNGNEVLTKEKVVEKREWLQTYDVLDKVPAFLLPITKTDYDLPNCTTRNQTLFNYILVLQLHRFTKDEVRKTVKVINDFIFHHRLSDKEIDTITRDDAFSEELFFDKEGRFLHSRFGDYMLSNCNILTIDDMLYIYNRDGVYSSSEIDFHRIMLDKIKTLKLNQQKEVFAYLQRQCRKQSHFTSPRYIGLKESVLDIETLEEFPYSPKWIIQNKIDYAYNPRAYFKPLDDMLDKVCCGDKEIRLLLEEMIGYTLYRENSMQVCFILTGNGSNGKSTLMDLIKYFLGVRNYTALDMRELEERFKKAHLLGKLANIGDDIDNKFLSSDSTFKKTVSGETVMAEKKGKDEFMLDSYATHIFGANELPMVKDKSDGFSRRIIIVPFDAKFSPTDPDYDPFIKDKLESTESMEYLLKLAIDGLRRVLSTRRFTQSTKAENEKQEYIRSNNNVLEWFESEPHIENEGVNEIYLMYQVWCTNNGCMPVKKTNLSKEIKKQFKLTSKVKSINGKAVRVYAKEEDDE
jgi:putative DNA primase/helicase